MQPITLVFQALQNAFEGLALEVAIQGNLGVVLDVLLDVCHRIGVQVLRTDPGLQVDVDLLWLVALRSKQPVGGSSVEGGLEHGRLFGAEPPVDAQSAVVPVQYFRYLKIKIIYYYLTWSSLLIPAPPIFYVQYLMIRVVRNLKEHELVVGRKNVVNSLIRLSCRVFVE